MSSLSIFFRRKSTFAFFDRRIISFFIGKRNTIFSEHLQNIPQDHVFGKRNTIFLDDTRRIIFQCDFLGTPSLQNIKKICGFPRSVGQICAILTMPGNTWLKLVLIVRNKKFMMLGSLSTKHDFVRSIMFS